MTVPAEAVVARPHGRDLHVDIYPPTAAALHACVVVLHGGAWMFGDRKDMAPHARALAAHGFTVVAAEYRLSGEAIWPAQLRDVVDVVAWVKQSASALGIVAERVALLGCSAGGHLALMAAGQVAAVVAICAPPELILPPPQAGPNPIAALLGPNAGEAAVLAASPIAQISAASPPTCLIGASSDTLVPPAALVEFYTALLAAGASAELHLYNDHAHAFDALPSMLGPVQDQVALFLKRTMVDPQHYRKEAETLNPFAQPGRPPMPRPAALPAHTH